MLCSVLQCVAECQWGGITDECLVRSVSSMLCSALQCVAVCCSALQRVAECYCASMGV